jgi:hypothetical protein
MDTPITIRFRWTADELVQANRYHLRHVCRPAFRIGVHCFFGVLFLGGVLTIFSVGSSGRAPISVTLALLSLSVYWFAVLPYEWRWRIRRKFNKRPDRDTEVEWVVTADTLQMRGAHARGETSWQGFSKLVCTPAGFLLYPIDQMFYWVPRHGFAD